MPNSNEIQYIVRLDDGHHTIRGLTTGEFENGKVYNITLIAEDDRIFYAINGKLERGATVGPIMPDVGKLWMGSTKL